MRNVKSMLFRFVVVLSCICIAVPLFDIIVAGTDGNSFSDIDIMLLQIVLLSLLTALGDLILGDINLTRRFHIVRLALHYVYINVLVIGFGCIVGWFDYKNPIEIVAIAVIILLIYIVNVIATYLRALSVSKKINEKLSDMNGDDD